MGGLSHSAPLFFVVSQMVKSNAPSVPPYNDETEIDLGSPIFTAAIANARWNYFAEAHLKYCPPLAHLKKA